MLLEPAPLLAAACGPPRLLSTCRCCVPTGLPCAGISGRFRPCAYGNLGAPLLVPAANDSAVQLALLVSGFACSSDTAVASAGSPGLFTWLPHHAGWLGAQLRDLQ